MEDINRSYWEEVLYQQSCDLLVIGAGITGQSLAYFFKKKNPDARVIVVDRGNFPIGASTRNAGFACVGSVGELIADLEIEEEEKLKNRLKSRYEGLLLLRQELGDEFIDYDHCGGYELFITENEFHKAAEQIPVFNAWLEELIGVKNAYSKTKVNGYHTIFNACEGKLHSGKMMKRLHELSVNTGVEFRFNTSVALIEQDLGKVRTTDGISFEAENVAITTNAFTNTIIPEIDITPGRGYIFVTRPIKNLQWKGTFHYNKGYLYFRNIGDRLLIGGGRDVDINTESTHSFGINPHIKKHLLDFAGNHLNLPDDWGIEQEWSGIMGFTPSKSPILEKVSDKIVFATGLGGMGVALGMNLGKKGAELIAT